MPILSGPFYAFLEKDDYVFYQFSKTKDYEEARSNASKHARNFAKSVFESILNQDIVTQTQEKKKQLLEESDILQKFLDLKIRKSVK